MKGVSNSPDRHYITKHSRSGWAPLDLGFAGLSFDLPLLSLGVAFSPSTGESGVSGLSGMTELVTKTPRPLGSASGSLLVLMRPPRRVMEKLRRPSPDWLTGRLCFPRAKRDAALDSRDPAGSSLGLMTGELASASGVMDGVTAPESVKATLWRREPLGVDPACEPSQGFSSAARDGRSASEDSRILGGLLRASISAVSATSR